MTGWGVSRRAFLGLVAAGAAAACTSGSDSSAPRGADTNTTILGANAVLPDLVSSPFTLGVASGDPLSDSVILWTRLVGADIPTDPIPVAWDVATDDGFDQLVASGQGTADPAFGHSVHVDASGLDADTWYFYRFRVGRFTSATGRTRTTPADDALPSDGRLRVGFASCQDWQDGYYTAYPHLVAENLDLMLFLGDYIYEGGPSTTGVRQHDTPEVTTLDAYRARYALYKSDAGLQAAQAACPWVVTWDDHEVENDYAGEISENRDPTDEFAARRAAGYQAFYEHMPIRIDPPNGDDALLYRDVVWGRLASFFVLDGRQYRTDQPCDTGAGVSFGTACADLDNPDHTMLGPDQRQWLLTGLADSPTTWNVLANQTVMTHLPIGGAVYNFDQWDGYPAERRAILEQVAADHDTNLVVVTGDIHAFGVGRLQVDDGGPVVGSEFVGGAISSTFPEQFAGIVQDSIGQLPQIEFADLTDHGYGVLELTPETCRCELRGVTTTKEPQADIRTLGTWTVAAGTPGPVPT